MGDVFFFLFWVSTFEFRSVAAERRKYCGSVRYSSRSAVCVSVCLSVCVCPDNNFRTFDLNI